MSAILFGLAYFITLFIALLENTNAREARKELDDLREDLIDKNIGEYRINPLTKNKFFRIK